MVLTRKKQFRPRRIARTKEEILRIKKRAMSRKSNFVKKRNELLVNLDKSVMGFKSVLEILLKEEKGSNKIYTKDFLNSSKNSLLNSLSFMRENADKYKFGEVQIRSILIFENKLSNANTLGELNLAFDYFYSRSCMLKLSKR